MAAAYSGLFEHPGSEPIELDRADAIAAPDGSGVGNPATCRVRSHSVIGLEAVRAYANPGIVHLRCAGCEAEKIAS